MAKSENILGPYLITSVRLDTILEQDLFTAQLLASQQFEIDVAVDLECWDVGVIKALAARLLPILVRRQGGYQYLGAAHTLRLLQEVYEPHHEVLAIVLEAKRVSTKVKLDVLAGDLLLLPPFFRTRRFLPLRNMQLWQAIVEAGGAPIRGQGVRAFSRATGYSHNSLKPTKPKKAIHPQAKACAQPPESLLMEDTA